MTSEFKDVPTYVATMAGAVRAVLDRATEFEDATETLCEIAATPAPAGFDGHHEPYLITKLEEARDACRRGLGGVSEAMDTIWPTYTTREVEWPNEHARTSCCICGKEIGPARAGHNPWPIVEDSEESGAACCPECDRNYVSPARTMMADLDSDGLLAMAANMRDADCTPEAIHGTMLAALDVRQAARGANGTDEAKPTKATDADMDTIAILDAAHVDALSARAALGRLTSLVVQGVLDLHDEADMDSFVVFAEGIAGQIGAVAGVLQSLGRTTPAEGRSASPRNERPVPLELLDRATEAQNELNLLSDYASAAAHERTTDYEGGICDAASLMCERAAAVMGELVDVANALNRAALTGDGE